MQSPLSLQSPFVGLEGVLFICFCLSPCWHHISCLTELSVCLSEIPLFHVLNARVTFSNLCGCDEPVSSVTVHKPESPGEAGNY